MFRIALTLFIFTCPDLENHTHLIISEKLAENLGKEDSVVGSMAWWKCKEEDLVSGLWKAKELGSVRQIRIFHTRRLTKQYAPECDCD